MSGQSHGAVGVAFTGSIIAQHKWDAMVVSDDTMVGQDVLLHPRRNVAAVLWLQPFHTPDGSDQIRSRSRSSRS